MKLARWLWMILAFVAVMVAWSLLCGALAMAISAFINLMSAGAAR